MEVMMCPFEPRLLKVFYVTSHCSLNLAYAYSRAQGGSNGRFWVTEDMPLKGTWVHWSLFS